MVNLVPVVQHTVYQHPNTPLGLRHSDSDTKKKRAVVTTVLYGVGALYKLQATCYRRGAPCVWTHDAYENTWKCGELELYFSPSAGELKKKKMCVF